MGRSCGRREYAMSDTRPVEVGERTTHPRTLIAIHITVVVLAYGVALLAGDGLAPAPFPPDSPPRRSVAVQHEQSQIAVDDSVANPAREVMDLGSDLRAPWTFDASGQARFAEH